MEINHRPGYSDGVGKNKEIKRPNTVEQAVGVQKQVHLSRVDSKCKSPKVEAHFVVL